MYVFTYTCAAFFAVVCAHVNAYTHISKYTYVCICMYLFVHQFNIHTYVVCMYLAAGRREFFIRSHCIPPACEYSEFGWIDETLNPLDGLD